MPEEKVTLAFTREELALLWDGLTHKDRYHREFWATLESNDSTYRQRALDMNSQILAKVHELSHVLEEAMQHMEPQPPVDDPHKDPS